VVVGDEARADQRDAKHAQTWQVAATAQRAALKQQRRFTCCLA
jgi:hypothetical protein